MFCHEYHFVVFAVCLEEDFPDATDESCEMNNKPGQNLITLFY